jgi:hypothetical protein
VSVTDSSGKFYAPDDAWIAADDGFDRAERRFEAHYFDARRGAARISVPVGNFTVQVMKGFEY